MSKEEASWVVWAGCVSLIVLLLMLIPFFMMGCFAKKKVWVSMGFHTITSYNAVRAQTDSTPDIGAYGRVADHGKPLGNFVACNFLPKNTKVIIPKIYGNRVFIVMDRMNRRYKNRVDVLLPMGQNMGVRKERIYVLLKEVQ